MTRRIAVAGGTGPDASDVSDEAIARRITSGEPFWLDLHGLDDADVSLLRDAFGLHPLALEDAQKFGQRARSRSTATSPTSSPSAPPRRRTWTGWSRCTSSTPSASW